MDEATEPLSVAGRIYTTNDSFTFRSIEWGVAGRTMGGDNDLLLFALADFDDRFDNFRDDIAGSLNENSVPNF